jgi:tRNA 2-selenouridine synthase
MIGNVTLPDIFFRLISASPIIVLEIDAERRVENLVREYAGFDPSLLREALAKLRQRLGGELLNKALMALEAGDFHQVAAISLQYYDKAYRFALSRRKSPKYFLSPRQPFEELDSRLVTEFIKTIPQ